MKWIYVLLSFLVRINVTGQFYIVNGGLKDIYKTEQIHFHWGDANPIGSEHKFNGRQAPLEVGIVSARDPICRRILTQLLRSVNWKYPTDPELLPWLVEYLIF